jgi:hypothetical protein
MRSTSSNETNDDDAVSSCCSDAAAILTIKKYEIINTKSSHSIAYVFIIII